MNYLSPVCLLRATAMAAFCFLFSVAASAHETDTVAITDSILQSTAKAKNIHRIELQITPSAILHTNPYLKGNNPEMRHMNHDWTYHLKYAFMPPERSYEANAYSGVYQGIGVAWHHLNPQLGNPVSVYLYQGAHLARLAHRLWLNYEWNLGLAMGWNPYDAVNNPDNKCIGSKVTAYIDADIYLNWRLSDHFDLNTGLSLSHFSNGNTALPNYGLNTLGLKVGLAYYVNRTEKSAEKANKQYLKPFRHHFTYDLILFGAWRQRGTDSGGDMFILPQKYGVVGFNFNPMYGINRWLKAGVSLDGVYDHSSNLYYDPSAATDDDGNSSYGYVAPSASEQMALGLSARAEFTMPYFSINLGVGHNMVNAHREFAGWYQTLALKLHVTPRLLLHIGYSLYNCKTPNHLMLGMGWRFGKLK